MYSTPDEIRAFIITVLQTKQKPKSMTNAISDYVMYLKSPKTEIIIDRAKSRYLYGLFDFCGIK